MHDEHFQPIDITETVERRSVWYLLLRVHDHIWKDFGFPFRQRYEASKIPTRLWEELWLEKLGLQQR